MRLRQDSYSINTAMKYKIIQQTGIPKDDSKKKENYDQLKDYASSNIFKKESTSYEPSYNIPLHPPKYEFQKKNYVSKAKPVKFHERATIARLDPMILGEINSTQKPVNFLNFMAMFDSENELDDVDIQKLLNVDYETIGALKEKVTRIMGYVNSCSDQSKGQAISVLQEKIQQLDNNLQNIDSIASNIENIDKIIYGPEETKIVFQNK